MRNSSDIFCLNENRTDGMQMFSVNGACPLKINRRKPREDESFQYGQLTTEEHDRGDGAFDAKSIASGVADIDGIPTPEDADIETYEGAIDELSAAPLAHHEAIPQESTSVDRFPENRGQMGAMEHHDYATSLLGKKKEKSHFRKLNSRGSDSKIVPVSVSSISRNPLTGAGMETTEYRKPKKGPKDRAGKWLW